MFDLLLRHARLVDDTLTNIALQDGKIAALGDVDGPAVKTIDLRGECYVSAGCNAANNFGLIHNQFRIAILAILDPELSAFFAKH